MSVSSSVYSEQYPQQMPVSFRFLLGLYAIVPLCMALQLLDQYGLNFTLRDMLPNSPGHFLLFQLLFGTPHILASNLLLISHADYRAAFKSKMLGMTLFIVLFFGVGSLFIPYYALYVITACWTVYHVLKQQHGIAKAVCRLPTHAFYLQLGFSVSAGIFIYLGIFLQNTLSAAQADWVFRIATGLSLALLCSTLYAQRLVPNRYGLVFLWANTLLVLCSWYMYLQHYYFLAILIPRLVHDICAYSFYVSHDVNRQRQQPSGGLYWLARLGRLPVVLVLPLSSLLLTWLLQDYGDTLINLITRALFATEIHKAVTLGFIGYCSLMHYYTEAFVWSAGSPLRRYIRFTF
jgi:uncharacterized membrane protein (UPF0136 family)